LGFPSVVVISSETLKKIGLERRVKPSRDEVLEVVVIKEILRSLEVKLLVGEIETW
jgi:hypothetical protein